MDCTRTKNKAALKAALLLVLFAAFDYRSAMAQVHYRKEARTPAFPGAEGFGRYATGGRGGKVMIVKNLDDAGEGSFREAVEAGYPRMVIFAVAGTIHLQSRLNIKGNVTIAGQTAPGDGICLADYPVTIGGSNIIVRYLRFRMGDKNQKGGMVDGNGGDDAFGGLYHSQVIIDHCSMSWSTDEVFSVYGGDSTTLQWNLIAEPLDYSYHYETGDKDYEHHGFGAIWGGAHTSAHHNLFVHCGNRTPRFDGQRNIPYELVDYRNNVIYNWSSNNVYAGEGGHYNIVNNYYKWGPSTNPNVRNRIVNPYKKLPKLNYGHFYLSGNYVDDAPDVTANNWLGVAMNEGQRSDTVLAQAATPFEVIAIRNETAQDAYRYVLAEAGASLHRDTLDVRLVNDVQARRGRLVDVQGGYPHGTPYEMTVKAWPTLKSAKPEKDTDGDGIPDKWEKEHHLDPKNPADANTRPDGDGYTNIERYTFDLALIYRL